MQFVSSESPLSFEVTYDSPTLDVGMTVLDDSGPVPVNLGTVAMQNVIGNTYRGKFTPQFGKSYVVHKAVYTDALLNVLHPDYSQASESVVCQPVKMQNGQIEVKKNQPLPAFMFVMLDVVNQNPISGLAPVAQRSLDGGPFAQCDNLVTEVGNGFYKIDLTAADLNADVVGLRFYALGADDTLATIITQE